MDPVEPVDLAGKSPGDENRWGSRIACHARVEVSATGPGLRGTGRMRDVSGSGAFIETPLAVPLYSQILVALLNERGVPGQNCAHATVVRTEFDGVGIEWREILNSPICPAL